jgi:adenylosuccinate lyase
MLRAISPLDGRYQNTTSSLSDYFSEYALIYYRVKVEIEYLKSLIQLPLPELKDANTDVNIKILDSIVTQFTLADAEKIKTTEKVTNHDVKG